MTGFLADILIKFEMTGGIYLDWITGIQNAINYIENNITEELDYEAIAKESFSSSFRNWMLAGLVTPAGSSRVASITSE